MFILSFFIFMLRCPPISTLFPYTTLFRSADAHLFDLLLPGLAGMVLSCLSGLAALRLLLAVLEGGRWADRKSTRLNSSHANISYAVFCLKKKKQKKLIQDIFTQLWNYRRM